MRVISHGSRLENKIAFTFDDGPNPHSTLKILKILNQDNIKASFFLIGFWAEKYSQIVKEIHSEGHLIGNHTYSHKIGDFKKAHNLIRNILQEDVLFIRPPYFDLNFCTLEKDFTILKTITLGDVDSHDYEDILTKNVVNNVLYLTQNGSIIDFHDGSENMNELIGRPKKTIEALPILISSLKENYTLSRLDEMNLQEKINNTSFL